jgi:hypothetical protein
MMETEPMADLLRSLGESPVPPEDASLAAARRRRVVHRLEGALRGVRDERARAAAQRARVAGVVAAAAVVLVGVGVAWLGRRAASPLEVAGHLEGAEGAVAVRDRSGSPRSVTPPLALAAHDTVATFDGGRAQIRLESGVAVDAEGETAVEVDAPFDRSVHPDEAIALAHGRIGLRVPRRPEGTSFRVRTPDVEVVVRGTAFTVWVCEGCGGTISNTRVAVSEGVVGVVHAGVETLVYPGQTWPPSAAAAPSVPVGAEPPAAVAPGLLETSKPPAPSVAVLPQPVTGAKPSAAPPTPSSTLAEQNRLYQSALEARRRGDDARAVVLLDELLTRFPGSPLAQEARVERVRALAKLGRAGDAAVEARRYLADYPDGFAREEARERAIPAASASPRSKP